MAREASRLTSRSPRSSVSAGGIRVSFSPCTAGGRMRQRCGQRSAGAGRVVSRRLLPLRHRRAAARIPFGGVA